MLLHGQDMPSTSTMLLWDIPADPIYHGIESINDGNTRYGTSIQPLLETWLGNIMLFNFHISPISYLYGAGF